jgi:hypothetical protein
MTYLTITLLAFAQSVSFSLVSRSRNRSSINYHIIASVLSNAIWYLTFRHLVTANMTLDLLAPYTAGTVGGSVLGVKISMVIERWLGASSDGHLERQVRTDHEGQQEKGRKENVVRNAGKSLTGSPLKTVQMENE